jgi:hypothetical protein
MLALHYLAIRVNWMLRGSCLDVPDIYLRVSGKNRRNAITRMKSWVV